MKSTIKQFKNGFTLAEVLITLVIVGVVAALTIPNIVYNSKKQEYSSRLKKFYSTMRQVEQKAMADGKSWVDWAETNNFTNGSSGEAITTSFINSCILPYMSYSKATSNTVYLNDGSYFSLRKGTCFDFTFDVNGGKNPNQYGYDLFFFYIVEHKGIVPSGSYSTSDRTKSGEGITCAARVLRENAINY